MIRVFLLEDEPPALHRLENAIEGHRQARVVGHAASNAEAATKLNEVAHDLIIADIELADGRSFRLFEEHPPTAPVIFCTAYDEHILEALSWNGIDYVLKPIRPARIHEALDKYDSLRRHFMTHQPVSLEHRAGYRRRLIVKRRSEFLAVPVDDVAYVASEHRLSVAVMKNSVRHILDDSVAQLESELDPASFLRANRQYLVHIDAVSGFTAAGKGRIELHLEPQPGASVIVSQKTAKAFRLWIERSAKMR